jgi:Zn-dependent peptidase ImmA (M78 family)
MSTISQLRNKRGLSSKLVSEVSKIPPSRLVEIEKTGIVTAKEEQALAAVLGVPEYALTLPPSDIETLPMDFRTTRNEKPVYQLRGLEAIYRMQGLAEFSSMIGEKLQAKPSLQSVKQKYKGGLTIDEPNSVVSALTDLTGYNFAEAVGRLEPSELFSALRQSVENADVFVVCERLLEETYRGFCIANSRFPIVFINTYKQPPRSRIFTLIHEMAHVLIGEGGVVDPFNNRNIIEKTCNKIVANFLMPHDQFEDWAEKKREKNPIDWVDSVAEGLPISKFSIAIRIQEVFGRKKFVNQWLGLVNRNVKLELDDHDSTLFDLSDESLIAISEVDIESKSENFNESEFPPRQTAASYQVSRLGDAVLSLLKAALATGLISKYDVYDHLGVRAPVIEKAIESAKKKRSRVMKFQ